MRRSKRGAAQLSASLRSHPRASAPPPPPPPLTHPPPLAQVRGSAAPANELSYILTSSGSKALIVEDAATLAKLLPSLADRQGPPLAFAAVLWGKADVASTDTLPFPVLDFDQMLSYGRSSGLSALKCELAEGAASSSSRAPRTRARHLPQPGDLATLVYTSGTTGSPKGARLTHGNLMYQLRAFTDIIRPQPGDRALSILPIWHVYERTAAYYLSSCAASIAYTSVKVCEMGDWLQLRTRDDVCDHANRH